MNEMDWIKDEQRGLKRLHVDCRIGGESNDQYANR